MSKDIRTNEADLNLVKKFLAYANCADASYALILFIFLLILFNGCSQYDKFKELCEKESSQTTIHNECYWEIFSNRKKGNTQHDDKGEYYYSKKLNKKIYFDYQKAKYINVSQKDIGKITDTIFEAYYDNIHYATIHSYSYSRKGIFLGGDEANGFHFYYEKTDYCKDIGY
ncbi:hypothetical protein [Helicobacter sp. MIT 14-3879]|uniref:hypothetical protein n=1 Tax=Helicobacter sp. MIT 14-3879 TaxID=2040649 RepID=UPI0015F17695|nr:hypothetical protein [Helicobacter sp. MIT 14-3879]